MKLLSSKRQSIFAVYFPGTWSDLSTNRRKFYEIIQIASKFAPLDRSWEELSNDTPYCYAQPSNKGARAVFVKRGGPLSQITSDRLHFAFFRLSSSCAFERIQSCHGFRHIVLKIFISSMMLMEIICQVSKFVDVGITLISCSTTN